MQYFWSAVATLRALAVSLVDRVAGRTLAGITSRVEDVTSQTVVGTSYYNRKMLQARQLSGQPITTERYYKPDSCRDSLLQQKDITSQIVVGTSYYNRKMLQARQLSGQPITTERCYKPDSCRDSLLQQKAPPICISKSLNVCLCTVIKIKIN